MHATQLLNNYLLKMCQDIHQYRLVSLMSSVRALICGQTLSVTGIGRALKSGTTQKHNIKRADRLVGNPKLHKERNVIYGALLKWLLKGIKQPVIIVDWSDLMSGREYHLLRAAIPMGGRSLTVYEEVHPEKQLGHPRVHRDFLRTLKTLLPAHCQPVFVTDAGFGNTWYQAVEKQGWDWLGRLRRRTLVMPEGEKHWTYCDTYHENATGRARAHGRMRFARSNPVTGYLYTLKKTYKGRIKKTASGQQAASKHSQHNALRGREPWVLVSSLNRPAKTIMTLYRTRMQIEEAFRDIKNTRWGLGLRHSKTYTRARFENLLLIAHLATWAVWLVGKIALNKGWHRQFQANTTTHRRVLSTVFLGIEVIKKPIHSLTKTDYQNSLASLRQAAQRESCLC